MKQVTFFFTLLFSSIFSIAQTWVEDSDAGSVIPTPATITSSPEPFDLAWRKGYVGIGTVDWPKTHLQVHGNDNVDTELDALFTGYLGGLPYNMATNINSNGGNSSYPLSIANLNFAFRNADTFHLNFGSLNVAQGDGNKNNIGTFGASKGNDNIEMFGVMGTAEGNNGRNVGVYGIADGGFNNYGMYSQCLSNNDPNSINIGIYARGIPGYDTLGSTLINIGVHGKASCNPSSGSQFNCGVFGQNYTCTDSTYAGGDPSMFFPTGSFAGYFDGNVLVNGNLWQLSDERLKENVKKVENITDKIDKVNIYSYQFKNMGLSLPRGNKEYGVIAQELEKVFPELVQELIMPNNGEEENYRNLVKYKGVEYVSFIPLLIQANKELNQKIKTLEASIDEIKSNLQINDTENLAPLPANKTIKIYPNPTDGELKISFDAQKGSQYILVLTDLAGAYLIEKNIGDSNTVSMNLKDYKKGIYLVHLFQSGKIIATEKVFLEK